LQSWTQEPGRCERQLGSVSLRCSKPRTLRLVTVYVCNDKFVFPLQAIVTLCQWWPRIVNRQTWVNAKIHHRGHHLVDQRWASTSTQNGYRYSTDHFHLTDTLYACKGYFLIHRHIF
jgi:hypothetical protein